MPGQSFFIAKIALIFGLVFLSNSCRVPDSLGFYQPITLSLAVPDGPPEFKSGWHAGCKTALAYKTFANAWVYGEGKGPDYGTGVYQHDPTYQTAWSYGFASCALHVGGFVSYPTSGMKFGLFD